MWKVLVFVELIVAFVLLFSWMRRESIIHNLISRAYESMEEAASRRIADNRLKQEMLRQKKGKLYRLEQRLLYSGLPRRFPFLRPEVYVVGNLLIGVILYTLVSILTQSGWYGLIVVAVFEVLLYFFENYLIAKNYNATDEGLLKFLDFLGNYSLTSGEITAVLGQVGEYLEEPLKSALEECCYEAQMTGDAGIALLSMAEKNTASQV